jgi:leader peptidase (prepilin peptidase) / N-methyltransferase
MQDNIYALTTFLNFSAWYNLPILLQYSIIFILSLCIGSFINVVVYRLPIIFEQELQAYIAETNDNNIYSDSENVLNIHQNKNRIENTTKNNVHNKSFSLSYPASRCNVCGYTLKYYDNIPIISWLFLRGTCRKCKTPISIQYPLVELVCGVGSVLCYWVLQKNGMQVVFGLLTYWLLLTITVLDAKTKLLPQELSQPLIFLSLLAGAFNIFINANEAIMGVVISFLLLWLVAFIFKLIKGYEGMGNGDPYLLAGIGGLIGIQYNLYTIFIASILGIIYTLLRYIKKDISQAISFGPFIAGVGFVIFLWLHKS